MRADRLMEARLRPREAILLELVRSHRPEVLRGWLVFLPRPRPRPLCICWRVYLNSLSMGWRGKKKCRAMLSSNVVRRCTEKEDEEDEDEEEEEMLWQKE